MRRSFVAVVLAVVAIGVSTVQAKDITAAPPAQQAAAAAPAQAPAADPLKFTGDEAAFVVQVKPGMSADFEAAYADVFKTMAASKKPEIVALLGTMKLFKVNLGTPADAPTVYLMHITKPSAELSYNYGLIIYYSGKPVGAAYDGIYEKQDDATVVYKKIEGAIAAINPWPLTKIGG